jgi:hypothetical protein
MEQWRRTRKAQAGEERKEEGKESNRTSTRTQEQENLPASR